MNDICSQCPTCSILDRLLAFVSSSAAVRDERDMLKNSLRDLTGECEKLRSSVTDMTYCIRDGIERAYSSWDDWQSVARETLRVNDFKAFSELERYKMVLSRRRKKEAK